MPETKLPTVREHADAVIDKLMADNPPSDEARQAAAIPTFSAGTRALDPNNGKPIDEAPPAFADGKVALEIPAGDAKPVAPPPAAAPAPGPVAQPEAPPAAAAGAAAAEAAAAAIAPDLWADAEEFEFDEPDLETPVTVRVPKQFAETVKRGYGRRAAHDRALSYLNAAKPVLQPLIEDGRLAQILPLIQRALSDPAYGDYVWGGFQRATQGLPLMEQARAEAAAAAATAAPAPAPGAIPGIENLDPFFAEQLTSVIAPLQRQLQTYEQRETERAQRERVASEEQQARNAQLATAHQDLARMYPSEYKGDLGADGQKLQRAIAYAHEAGYVQRYGLAAGVVFAGQQLYGIEQERIVATGSPSAAALDAHMLDTAKQQAAAAARTVSGGGPASPQPAPAPPRMPLPKNPDGTMKPSAQYLAEVQAALAAGATP